MFAAPFLLGATGMSHPATLPTGSWGGEQVVLEVGPDRAVLRLGCGEGEFAAPVSLDADGRFALTGSYSAEAGGPSTPADRSVPARYEGQIQARSLTLTVRHGDAADTYRLSHGLAAKVIRCL